jgi:alpha/beta superfamily hydrolase
MARRIESLFVPGPAGRLEAILEEPEDVAPIFAALVCHPHPQHGGTMHNKVVHRMARALRRRGAVVLRFNYRGVNLSDGVYDHGKGEIEDARSALSFLRARYPELPYTLAGFSFGSRIILRLGCELPDVEQLIAAGFPVSYQDSGELGQCTRPKLFVVSTSDQFCGVAAMEAYFAKLPEPKKLKWVKASDHFFNGALDVFEEAIGTG